jgi:hypothetical protein
MSNFSSEDINYPRDFFSEMLEANSPYVAYILQWVPYQAELKQNRVKLLHDVKTFDGRTAMSIWPNGSSCGPFKDSEVEFIRINKDQWKSKS